MIQYTYDSANLNCAFVRVRSKLRPVDAHFAHLENPNLSAHCQVLHESPLE